MPGNENMGFGLGEISRNVGCGEDKAVAQIELHSPATTEAASD